MTDRRREEIAGLLASIAPEQHASLVESLQWLAQAAGELPERAWSAR